MRLRSCSGMPGPESATLDGKMAIDGLGGHSHLACIRELDGVAHEIEKHLR